MKNLLIFLLFCFLISCGIQSPEVRNVKLAESPKYPRLEYAGVVQSSHIFGNSQSSATFIVTNLTSVSVVGKFDIPIGTKCYVVYDETELISNATFYWDGEKEPHKIVRK
jgi:hypothetical protein